MAINLSSYSAIQSNLFVRINVEQYSTTAGGPYTTQVLRFSDRHQSYTLNGESYQGLGNLVDVTQANSELRVTGDELTVTISGIPNTSISEIVNSRIKGSNIQLWRVVFDPVTNTALNITGNPVGRFQGYVNNVTLQEEFDIGGRSSSNLLILNCSSVIDVLNNKVAGRRTNTTSQNRFFPNDTSMDRVTAIENAYFDFGVQK
jgi:hypothetical protein